MIAARDKLSEKAAAIGGPTRILGISQKTTLSPARRGQRRP
jgi:hypothetical protein